jgi:hypothetical protein
MARQESSGLTHALDLSINRSNQRGNIHFGIIPTARRDSGTLYASAIRPIRLADAPGTDPIVFSVLDARDIEP